MIHSKKSFHYLLVVSIVLGMLIFNSCKHKTKFDELQVVSYTNGIAPIIASNCSWRGCHGADSLNPKFKLTNYESLIARGIKAGNPNESELYKRLKTLNKEKIMPKQPYPALSDKQIQLIYVWIGQGAKNN